MNTIRILYLISSFNRAGAESVVRNLVENFPKDNFEIQILCLTDEITAPRPQGNHPFHVGFGLPIRIKNKKLNVSLSTLYKTISLIRKIDPDIIHYHLIEGFGTAIIPLIKIFCKNENVVSIHTRKDYYFKKSFKNLLVKNLEKVMLSLSRSQIVVASEMEYDFFRRIFNSRRLCQINNGINTKFFSRKEIGEYSREAWGFSKDDFLITMVGRLHEIKNQELAIKALAITTYQIPSAKLLLLGKRGGQETNYNNLMRALSLEKNVKFLGEVDDVRPILKISDLGLFLSHKENLSIGLLEMMSMGLPVIFSDIPEFRSLFKETNKIPFVDPDNPQGLSKEIILMYHDRKRMDELGCYLRDYVQQQFSIDKQVQKHIELYKSLKEEITA